MKSRAAMFVLITAWSLCFFFGGAVNAANQPEVEALRSPWDFGRVKKGEAREKVFFLQNNGGETIVLDKIKACCGYSVIDVSSWEIAPGKKAKLRVSSDTSKKQHGLDQKTIVVTSNSLNIPILKVPVRTYIVESGAVPAITVLEIEELIGDGEKVVFVDVREKSEFSEKHAPNAVNLPRSIFLNVDDYAFQVLDNVRKETTVVVYCGGGIRSSYAAQKLREKGFNAFNLKGGIKELEKENFDLVRGPRIKPEEEPIRINLEEAYEHYYLIFKDDVVWVDVRDSAEFSKGHIDGAKNIELYRIEEAPELLPKNKQVVLYCDGVECEQSYTAGRVLIQNGFDQGRTMVLVDGFNGWEKADYPVSSDLTE